jgi:hypothetical protein
MRRSLLLAAALFVAAITTSTAQPFLISTAPRSDTITGAVATFTVTISAQVGFKASVFLSASIPTLPGATVTATPQQINAPYSDTVTITVTLTGTKLGGTHAVYITEKNGPSTVHDTVRLTIPDRSAWHVYDRTNSLYRDQAIRLRHGTGSLVSFNSTRYTVPSATEDSLLIFDGTSWSELPGPPAPDTNGYVIHQLGVDRTGDIWVACWIINRNKNYASGNFIARKHDTTWTIFDGSSSSGVLASADWSAEGPLTYINGLLAGPDSSMWIVSRQQILRYDGRSATWQSYTPDNSDMPGYFDNMTWPILDRQGSLWMVGSGFVRFDGIYWTAWDFMRDYPQVIPLGFGLDNKLRVRSYSFSMLSTVGYIFDDDALQHLPLPDSVYAKANCLRSDDDSTIWVGTAQGLWRFQSGAWYHYTIANSGLPNDTVLSVDLDDAGTIWVRTEQGLASFAKSVDPAALFTTRAAGVRAEAMPRAGSRMTIAPNPARDHALLTLTPSDAEHVRVTIVDRLGREVAAVTDRLIDGSSGTIDVDLSGLADGLYFLRASGEHFSESAPIMIER